MMREREYFSQRNYHDRGENGSGVGKGEGGTWSN